MAIAGQMLVRSRALLAGGASRAWRWARTPEGIAFCVLLLVSAAVRLALAPYHGFFTDVQAYVTWGQQLDHGPLSYYANSGSNYPPLTGYLDGLLVATCRGLCHVAPLTHAPSALALWMKVPALTADMVTIGLIYVVARKVAAARWAYAAAASFAFAPAVLFDGALWGQTDGLAALFVVVALHCALRGHGTAAGLSFAVALMLKLQPVIFGPLILVYLLRWRGWREAVKCAASALVVCLVVTAPYLLPPHPEVLTFARNVEGSIAQAPFASVSALNLWWFLGVQYVDYRAPLLGGLTATTLGDLGFGAVSVVVLAGVWLDRSAGRLFAAAAILATGFFVLTTLQRERYLYPAIVLFVLAAVYDRRYVRHYLVAGLTSFLNMAAIVALYYTGSDSGFPLAPAGTWLGTHGAYLVVVAGVNIWLLASATLVFVLTSRHATAARTARKRARAATGAAPGKRVGGAGASAGSAVAARRARSARVQGRASKGTPPG